jgi:hypothetical protein
MDWNNFIIPNPPFMYLYTDALPFEGGEGPYCLDDDWPNCGDIEECIEAELTPDEHFYENPWFTKSTEVSPLENADGNGPTVCTYGPWVRECVHGHKPEIHPSELLWWKEPETGPFQTTDLFWLMQMDDDSNRFDKEDNFDFGGPFSGPPAGWKPWAGAPRRNMFNVAFALNPSFQRIAFSVGQAADLGEAQTFSSRFVRTEELAFPGIPPDDTGRDWHRIRYNGQVIVEARELQAIDGDIGIRFVGVCRNAADNRLQGYLNIYTAVSESNDGEEGYQVLFASKTTSNQLLPPAPPLEEIARKPGPPTALSTRAIPDTLRRTVSDGHVQLVGDLEIRLETNRNVAADPRRIVAVNLVGGSASGFRRRLRGAPGTVERGDALSAIPLLSTETVEVVLDSGEVLEAGVGGVAFAPLPVAETPVTAELAPKAWPSLAKAAGAKVITAGPPLPLRHVPAWRLEVAPAYAAAKDGKPSLEDDSPWVEELNEALAEGETRQMERLFGTRQPFETAWRFEAVDVSTGERVAVAVDQPRAQGGVRVATEPGQLGQLRVPDTGVRVEFPSGPGDQVYRLRATAAVRDTFGNSGQVEFEVWSHVLSVESEAHIDALVSRVASMAEVSGRLLSLAAQEAEPLDPVVDFTAQEPRLRRARMVRTYARSAAMDERITVGELQNLVRAARQFGDDE